jgi:hypothetical protein
LHGRRGQLARSALALELRDGAQAPRGRHAPRVRREAAHAWQVHPVASWRRDGEINA